MAQAREIELHLQDGFSGEAVEITLDGAPVTHLTARTRMQTGLAHVERLQVRAGQTLAIAIPKQSLTAQLVLDGASPFVIAHLVSGELHIAHPEQPPRYA